MKKASLFALMAGICTAFTGCSSSGEGGGVNLLSILLVLLSLMLLALAALRVYSILQYNRHRNRGGRRRRPRKIDPMTWCMFALAAALLLGAMLGSCSGEPEETEPVEENKPKPEIALFAPETQDAAHPDNYGIRWEIFKNGAIAHAYNREEPIAFGAPEDYFALPGVATFRGNQYRDNASYGTAQISNQTISLEWSANGAPVTGGVWEGGSATGQPLVVKWDSATKSKMNLYEDKKNKNDLVEVIYAAPDGYIYFLDMEDGSNTRDPINMGISFKGSGSLDPRGYPLLYVGAGAVSPKRERPRMYVISLIDGKVLYQYGHEEALSYRRDDDNWCAFDSAPLVDAGTDTLIWPGESGVLYTIKLNTEYDKAAGTIAVTPETPVCTRYLTDRSGYDNYCLGYEASANIVGHYLYVSENGGLFYCVDLNTMELVWVQDTKDETYASSVFQWVSPTEGYIYTAPTLHWTQNTEAKGTVSIYKLDALTGEILWETPYDVQAVSGISGGVYASPVLGKAGSTIGDKVIYRISGATGVNSGVLVALNTDTGETVWTMDIDRDTGSSPVALYTTNGTAYIVVCDGAGDVMLVDGKTGRMLNKVSLGRSVNVSPVAFDNMLIVATDDRKINGIRVS